MQVTKPLFRFGSGWLYVGAGLAICAAAILVPVQQDLRDLQGQLREIRDKGHLVTLQLQASSELLDELEAGEPALIRRLAASQLNLVPADRTPLMRSLSPSQSVTDWVNATIRYERVNRTVATESMLGRMSMGTGRLWLFCVGALSVFIGLLMDPMMSRLRTLRLTRPWGRPAGGGDLVAVALEMTRAAGPIEPARIDALQLDAIDEEAADDERAVALELQRSAAGLDPSDLDDVEEMPGGVPGTVAWIEIDDDDDDKSADEPEGEAPEARRHEDLDEEPDDELSVDEIASAANGAPSPDAEVDPILDVPEEEASEEFVSPPIADDDEGRDITGAAESPARAGASPDDPVDAEADASTTPSDDDEVEDPFDEADDREEEAEWEYVDEPWDDDGEAPDEADDDEYEYEYEYVYVDEDGNEIDGDELELDQAEGTAA